MPAKWIVPPGVPSGGSGRTRRAVARSEGSWPCLPCAPGRACPPSGLAEGEVDGWTDAGWWCDRAGWNGGGGVRRESGRMADGLQYEPGRESVAIFGRSRRHGAIFGHGATIETEKNRNPRWSGPGTKKEGERTGLPAGAARQKNFRGVGFRRYWRRSSDSCSEFYGYPSSVTPRNSLIINALTKNGGWGGIRTRQIFGPSGFISEKQGPRGDHSRDKPR